MAMRNKKKQRKLIIWLSVICTIMLVLVALIPFITDQVSKYQFDSSWRSVSDQDPGNISPENVTEPGNNITGKSPNYSINDSYDQQFEVNSFSEIELVEGEYDDNDIHVKITDFNKTPIANQEIILSASFNRDMTGAYVPVVSGALAGGTIGTLIFPGVGTLIGAGIGALIGAGLSYGVKESMTYLDYQIITCDQGSYQNEYTISTPSEIGKQFGFYHTSSVTFELPETTLEHFADFSTTDIVLNVQHGSTVYIKLGNEDKRLLEFQDSCLNNSEIQSQSVDEDATYTSMGYNNGNYVGTDDCFYSVDATNNTAEYLQPLISINTNDVYKVTESRIICSKDLSGISNKNLGSGIYFYYIVWNLTNTYKNPELYGMRIEGIYLDNSSVATLESHKTYLMVFSFYINTATSGYEILPIINYMKGSNDNYEFIGKTKCQFSKTYYTTSFKYTYSNYFSSDQDIHRVIFNVNDKLPLICDVNAPLMLNETSISIKLRYFLDINTSFSLNDNLDKTNTFSFLVTIYIEDDNTTYIHKSISCKIGYDQIGFKKIDCDLAGTGIKELTSYLMDIRISSQEETGDYSGNRDSAIYSNCLFYIFKNYDDFTFEIKTMEDFITALADKDHIGDGTFDTAKEIIGTMKYKILDLETYLEEMKNANPETGLSYYKTTKESIDGFKTVAVALYSFMDQTKIEDLKSDGHKLVLFRDILGQLKMWYADSFYQYNSYICYLNGETGISKDFKQISSGFRNLYINKLNELKISNLMKYLPAIALLLTMLVSSIVSMIAYYVLKKKLKTKSKYVVPLICLVLFCILSVVLYMMMQSISKDILFWWYGFTIRIHHAFKMIIWW